MSIDAALNSDIFLTYLAIVGAVLATAGLLLLVLRMFGKSVTSAWASYRGWLVMVPIVLGVVFLGRSATIVGITLLAFFGFREFARATGLYSDWLLTGTVYVGIAILGVVAHVSDPRLEGPGWYGLFMALPVYVIGAVLLIPILRNRAKGQLQQVALAIVGFVYFGWMFSHLSFLANTPYAYGYLLYPRFRRGNKRYRPRLPAANCLANTSFVKISALTKPLRVRSALSSFRSASLGSCGFRFRTLTHCT